MGRFDKRPDKKKRERLDLQAVHCSVIGAMHEKKGMPLQDSSTSSSTKHYAIAVSCDGHGSAKHWRSDVGSQLAADIAREQLESFVKAYHNAASLGDEAMREQRIERLKTCIVSNWHVALFAHAQKHPFEEGDRKRASTRFDAERNIATAYGTTLLAALVTQDYYLVLMLGDGECVRLLPGRNGEVVEFEGKTSFSDTVHGVTESLCDEESLAHLHHAYGTFDPEQPIAIGLCSDGVSESFQSGQAIVKCFYSFMDCFAENGREETALALRDYLAGLTKRSLSRGMAGDDCTVSIAVRGLSAFLPPPKPLAEEKESESGADAAAQPSAEQSQDAPAAPETEQDNPKE